MKYFSWFGVKANYTYTRSLIFGKNLRRGRAAIDQHCIEAQVGIGLHVGHHGEPYARLAVGQSITTADEMYAVDRTGRSRRNCPKSSEE